MRGGSGKTTLSIGLIGALRKRGLTVASFKKGPDYIDAGWLAQASGRACYNLDPYLIGNEMVAASFSEHLGGAGCAVIEGNRGLFDGMDSEGSMSTSAVARALKAPVVLIADCTKATRTVAAMLRGVERFERGFRLGGIVLNHIAGARHESVIRDSIARHLRSPVLGAIPRLREPRMPERHMGLTPMHEHPGAQDAVSWATGVVEKYVDLDALWEVASRAPALAAAQTARAREAAAGDAPRIGVVKDSAFQFYYPENFDALMQRGARLVEISALSDARLPELDALYIGGGFPETHAIVLSENRSFRRSLRAAVEAGLPVYAECGGLIYLGESIKVGGTPYRMAGVLPIRFELRKKPQAHGYTEVKVTRANPFFRTGTVIRGHEFHYSKVTSVGGQDGLRMAFRMQRGNGIAGGRDALCYKAVLATYTHLHALGAPQWADGLVGAALKYRKSR